MSVLGRTGLALTVEGEKRGGKKYFQLTQGNTVSGCARSQDSVPSSLLITEEFALLQTCKKMVRSHSSVTRKCFRGPTYRLRQQSQY